MTPPPVPDSFVVPSIVPVAKPTVESLSLRIDAIERGVVAVLNDWDNRLESRLGKLSLEVRLDVERQLGVRMLEIQRQVGQLIAPLASRVDSIKAGQDTLLELVRKALAAPERAAEPPRSPALVEKPRRRVSSKAKATRPRRR